MLRILQEQNDLVIELFDRRASGCVLPDDALNLAHSGQPHRPHFRRGLGIRRQNHQPLRNFGLYHAREITFRCCLGDGRKCSTHECGNYAPG